MKQNTKVNIITMGCSKNLIDSEVLIKQLSLNGFDVVADSDKDDASVVIINTCGFINDAKEESVNTILSFADARKKGRIEKLLVMGCLSAHYGKVLSQTIPEVDRFYGKFDIPQIIKDLNGVYFANKFYQRVHTTPSHYAFLKIAEGCNHGCSFCAIPNFTGRYKSREPESLIKEAKELVTGGVKELLLVAQDLSCYGKDLNGEFLLPELVRQLSDINGLEWIRLHYTYPTEFPTEILTVMRERNNVCSYLDVPVQHISNNVLGLMHRRITGSETKQLLKKIRKEVPGISLRTTLLVGHPGETEQDFEELKDFIREYPFERLGVFTYSHEEDTYCYRHYKDDVPEEVKKSRASEIMEIQQNISAKLNRRYIGSTLKVLIDREEEDSYIGRTEYDSPEVDGEVIIKKEKPLITGNFYQVNITDTSDYDLFGDVIL
ncbi:MAG: 30S ribosomal protein S12 methylthiotransferase RimO [Prolixibacteraceae bacterium]|nr:30S ribosomal protein S12 methylthiotransferase RimO [Prolixibacteraceae bacterium]